MSGATQYGADWISTAAKKPAELQHVLACWSDDIDGGEIPMNVAHRIGKQWYDSDGAMYQEPTHWMNLPEPPK